MVVIDRPLTWRGSSRHNHESVIPFYLVSHDSFILSAHYAPHDCPNSPQHVQGRQEQGSNCKVGNKVDLNKPSGYVRYYSCCIAPKLARTMLLLTVRTGAKALLQAI